MSEVDVVRMINSVHEAIVKIAAEHGIHGVQRLEIDARTKEWTVEWIEASAPLVRHAVSGSIFALYSAHSSNALRP